MNKITEIVKKNLGVSPKELTEILSEYGKEFKVTFVESLRGGNYLNIEIEVTKTTHAREINKTNKEIELLEEQLKCKKKMLNLLKNKM